jgi:hypothetical protein
MFESVQLSARQILWLFRIDMVVAMAVMASVCQRCDRRGRLYWACFPRKCGGWGLDGWSGLGWRMSFRCSCCGQRTTPCSLRFFGGKRTPGPGVVALMAAESEAEVERLRRELDVSPQTARRWRAWWEGLRDPGSEVGRVVQADEPAVAVAARESRSGPVRLWSGGWLHGAAQMLVVLQRFTGGRLWNLTRWSRGPLPRQRMGLAPALEGLQTGGRRP